MFEIDNSVAQFRSTENKILFDGQIFDEIEMLMNERDAGLLGVGGGVHCKRNAGNGDLTRIGRQCAAKHFHQGGFAGAVLAHNADNLAGKDRKGYVIVRAELTI
jgi:hypothetical protein